MRFFVPSSHAVGGPASLVQLVACVSHGLLDRDIARTTGHAGPRTTRLYDRRHKRVTRNIVEHVSI